MKNPSAGAIRLPSGLVLAPRGTVWKLTTSPEEPLQQIHWTFPVEAEQLPRLFRRPRGLSVSYDSDTFEVEYEPYVRRLLKALLKARILLADWNFRHGRLDAAVRIYESVLPLDAQAGQNERMIHSMGLCYLAIGKDGQAESALRSSTEIARNPWIKASSWLGLGDLYRRHGELPRAQSCYEQAARAPHLTPEQQREVQERLKGK